MKSNRILSTIITLLLANQAIAATEVRLATHDSFDLPKELITEFEQKNDAKISIIKAGDGNELLNKLIISKRKPIADVVYGLDNGNILKANAENLLADKQPESAPTVVSMPHALGEEQAFDWWKQMRNNGVKVTKGWSEAYYKEFSLNGGSRPMMVGYSSSPAAEVFYSKGKLSTPNMGNLFLVGGVYRQMEGVAVLNGAQQPELAAKLAQYLQSDKVQRAVSTSMWVYPAVKNVPLAAVMVHSSVPTAHYAPHDKRVFANYKTWLSRWNKTV